MVFKYRSAPLLHDLNSMTMMLNAWEEHLHLVPNKKLKELVWAMEEYITHHDGKP